MTNSELKQLEFLVVHLDTGKRFRALGSSDLSPNFKVYEFASTDGCPVVVVDEWVINTAQKVRDKVHHACTIGRGFSSIPDNERVYEEAIKNGYIASLTSRHTMGDALDISPASRFKFRYTEDSWYNIVLDVLDDGDFGIGKYSTHVHADNDGRGRW